ncbi:MAG TPA: negative regulator of septation ring formation, partial [Xanthobacteraceae bacterium]|nr:negative regulator of septation ring formation [Xanthobacteraceae bacterium]
MANNPKKSKDPTEVALTAIQDALDMRESEPRNGTAAQREPVRALADDDLFVEPVAAPPREERPARTATLAANDDRANIGQILQSLQRRPARTPYWIAGIFSGAWVICALGLAYSYQSAFAALVAQGLPSVPLLVGLVVGFFAPVVFFFVLAHMLARSQELRMISQSMAQVAVRLAEPETIAHESIISVGQAIRREVAAMGDGVERALARAAELEALVNNEVTALERAYNDNEVRIRTLLDGLASQRETLVGQAEQVRTAITNVHLDLSHDITSVSEAVADRVNEAAQRIARALAEKGEHITVALGHAGDSMIDALGERGGDLLDRLERTSRETTTAIEQASDRLSSSLNFK